jgi:hypothetical protein
LRMNVSVCTSPTWEETLSGLYGSMTSLLCSYQTKWLPSRMSSELGCTSFGS